MAAADDWSCAKHIRSRGEATAGFAGEKVTRLLELALPVSHGVAIRHATLAAPSFGARLFCHNQRETLPFCN